MRVPCLIDDVAGFEPADLLTNLGRPDLAVRPAEQAVVIYRDSPPQPAQLARGLVVLASALIAWDKPERGLAAANEAMKICSDWKGEASNDEYVVGTYCLTTTAKCLDRLGRHEEAIRFAEIAVTYAWKLVEHRRGVMLPMLAASLNTWSDVLAAAGELQAGANAAAFAVATYRSVVESWPDAYMAELASSMIRLSQLQAQTNQTSAGLEAAEEAVALSRDILSKRSDHYVPNILRSWMLAEMQWPESTGFIGFFDKLSLVTHALSDYTKYHNARTETAEACLALSLSNLSMLLEANGRAGDSRVAAVEECRILSKLAEQRPDRYIDTLTSASRKLAEKLHAADEETESAEILSKAARAREIGTTNSHNEYLSTTRRFSIDFARPKPYRIDREKRRFHLPDVATWLVGGGPWPAFVIANFVPITAFIVTLLPAGTVPVSTAVTSSAWVSRVIGLWLVANLVAAAARAWITLVFEGSFLGSDRGKSAKRREVAAALTVAALDAVTLGALLVMRTALIF